MTDLNLDKLRREWFAAFISDLLLRSEVPSVRPDLGEPELAWSLLCARVAMLDGRGYRASEIGALLIESHLFTTPYPEQQDLDKLIKAVRRQTRFRGRFSPVNGALLPLPPDDVYLHLLEHWAAERSRSLTPGQIQQELTQFWGVKDVRVLQGLSSLPADPLKDYQNLLNRLKAEPDIRARNLAAGSLTHQTVVHAANLWFDRLYWDPNAIQHLFEIGDDLVRSRAAERLLSNTLAGTSLDSALAGAVSRALSFVRDHLESTADTLKGLSAFECDLIRERTADEQFQDGCLKAYLGWADPPFSGFSENNTARGVWGPLPWWSLATKDGQQRDAAAALLVQRGANLSVDASVPDLLDLRITAPGLGSSNLDARYSYALKYLPDMCELLLLARRGRVNVDILGESEADEWEQWNVLLYGTLVIELDGEVASDLALRATRALRALLPPIHADDLYPGGENIHLAKILQTAGYLMPEQGRFEAL
ncbi:hypothetical protein [Streptosporangium sp. NPDC006930]|uniref:hypothetical protein n=1 Tax=Streptosporangium sp. NPDC006930 TaxID=3154783 RepID=UPI003417B45A